MTEPAAPPPRRRSLLGGLRANFLTGLVVVLPVGLTIYVIWAVIGWIDAWVLPLVPAAYRPDALLRELFGEDFTANVRGLGLIVFIIFTVIIGWIAKGLIGRSLIRWGESVVARLPIVRSIYNALKQIAETVFTSQGTNFDTACLVEWPRKDVWVIGFISSRARGEVAERLSGDHVAIFMPTTPNPTTGYLMFVPARDVVILDMTVEEAAKLSISAGLVYPQPRDPMRPVAVGQG
jgi:uncharacterized membrane protein